MKKIIVLTAAIALFGLATPGLTDEILTNNSVIQMHLAGLPSSVILEKIKVSDTSFDTSVEELIALANSGVPEDVIAAMTKVSGAKTRDTTSTPGPTTIDQLDRGECPEPGIYLMMDDGSVKELEPSAYMGSKSGGYWKTAMTYGIASSKTKSMLQGMKANTRISNQSPIFYFCFEESESGLSHQSYGATTPGEFLLVKLQADYEENARVLVTGKFSAMSGGYSGPPPKYRANFTFEKIRDGAYKIMTSDLEWGEYAFFYTGSASSGIASAYGLFMTGGGGKVFDFSIE